MQIPAPAPARLLGILLTVTATVVAGCSTTTPPKPSAARAVFPQKGHAADPVVRPTVLTVAADGSVTIRDLTWSVWGSTTASGTGTESINDCKPNCANGHMTDQLVKVTLTQPHRVCGRRVFGEVSLTAKGRHPGTFPAHQTFHPLVDCGA